ncbi:MAG: 30S ribosomal protein S9 [Candidatus Berkelbacteria bacterium]
MIEEKEVKKTKTEEYWYGLGRRKTAIAKVKITKGTGVVTVNEKEIANPSRVYLEPLKVLGQEKNFNIDAKIMGGGIVAQLDAIRLGISRALDKFDSEWHTTLKKEGFLTRDQRMKERKKPGLKGARRAPQWTKR